MVWKPEGLPKCLTENRGTGKSFTQWHTFSVFFFSTVLLFLLVDLVDCDAKDRSQKLVCAKQVPYHRVTPQPQPYLMLAPTGPDSDLPVQSTLSSSRLSPWVLPASFNLLVWFSSLLMPYFNSPFFSFHLCHWPASEYGRLNFLLLRLAFIPVPVILGSLWPGLNLWN